MCGKSSNVEHAFSCSCGSFLTICHNEIRDLTANLLSKVCSDVDVDPALQPLDPEPLQYATASQEDGARLDVVSQDFLVGIGSMHFLVLECLTHLHAPILILHCLDAML